MFEILSQKLFWLKTKTKDTTFQTGASWGLEWAAIDVVI